MTAVPTTLEEATSSEWLSALLGAPVTTVQLGDVDQRVSTNVPVRLEFADGSSRQVWIKGYFSEAGREFRTAGVPEAVFYRDVLPLTSIRTLRLAAAEVDLETSDNVVITEDEVGRGATFLHGLDPYSVDQAAQSLEQLGILHSEMWMNRTVESMPTLDNRCSHYTVTRGVDDIRSNFGGPEGAGVPEPVRDAERLFGAFSRVAHELTSATPWTIIHGDPHLGNVFLDGEGRPSFADWQLVQRGPWYIDVGYHLSTVLTVDDRRSNERDLVEHYLDVLTAGGIDRPDPADVRAGLRRGMVHGFYLWGITRKVDPRKTAVLLERLGTAVNDHAALEEIAI